MVVRGEERLHELWRVILDLLVDVSAPPEILDEWAKISATSPYVILPGDH